MNHSTVVEAQGLSLKGSAKSPSAYVTVESPGFGTLHQTSSVGKGKKLVWHENTRIVELKPTAPIKFTVKRQAIWPMTHHVLGSTATYDIDKLIEMQGKNDRETCVSLSLNLGNGAKTTPSIVVNIRDLDTREDLQEVRESAYAASSKRRGKERETDCSDSMSEESLSARSLDSRC
ncbi:hypothetical protein M378DRAFT_917822 [Amanita muscaria Koide BX008]|uniref:C2 domain-containing protein n=1 Tax=Amanita muscaria (strain Koide BX008) TaxID=946122 RepID=A0A0C2T1X7_AMAMK|nr:hypothetical protein M378DRAFT_917822 [Amanita muscaria Koide BX008]